MILVENVYLVLNSLLDWKPVEELKQRCDFFTFLRYEALYATKALKQAGQKGENCSSQGMTE